MDLQLNNFENTLVENYFTKVRDFGKTFSSESLFINNLYNIYKNFTFTLNKSYSDIILGKGDYIIETFNVRLVIRKMISGGKDIVIFENTFNTNNIDGLMHGLFINKGHEHNPSDNTFYDIKYEVLIKIKDNVDINFFDLGPHLLDELEDTKGTKSFNELILSNLDKGNVAIICNEKTLKDLDLKSLNINIFYVDDYDNISKIVTDNSKKIIIGDIEKISRGKFISDYKGILNIIIITGLIEFSNFSAYHAHSFNSIFIGPEVKSGRNYLFGSYDENTDYNNRVGKQFYDFHKNVFFDINKNS